MDFINDQDNSIDDSSDQISASEVQANLLVLADVNVTTAPIPLTHVSIIMKMMTCMMKDVIMKIKDIYYRNGRYERKVSPMVSPLGENCRMLA